MPGPCKYSQSCFLLCCTRPFTYLNSFNTALFFRYQIFAISPDAIDWKEKSEHFLTRKYHVLVLNCWPLFTRQALTQTILFADYDIFVRHSFGNYRDILRENSYSPVMGEMLTYRDSTSTGYTWVKPEQQLEYPDENFAREIMQLFSIGLYKLNSDGTRQTENGIYIRAYTNEEITEYARAWTGFTRNYARGNLEKRSSSDNQVDPMSIDIDYRDHFPKVTMYDIRCRKLLLSFNSTTPVISPYA